MPVHFVCSFNYSYVPISELAFTIPLPLCSVLVVAIATGICTQGKHELLYHLASLSSH